MTLQEILANVAKFLPAWESTYPDPKTRVYLSREDLLTLVEAAKKSLTSDTATQPQPLGPQD